MKYNIHNIVRNFIIIIIIWLAKIDLLVIFGI
jgi:hypothetical protein